MSQTYLQKSFKLLDFQQEALTKYIDSDRTSYGLFLEQGLGKTLTSLCFSLELLSLGKIDQVQLVCPSGLKTNWLMEIKKFIKPEFHSIFLEPIGYPHLQRRKEVILTERTFVILDECHRLKNPQSKSTEYFLELFPNCYGVVLLSGTPLLNSGLDLYFPSKILGYADKGIMQFIEDHCVEKLMKKGKMHFYVYTSEVKNRQKLMEGLSPYSSWIKTKDVMDLPEQLHVKKFYSINKKQKALLNVARGKIKAESVAKTIPEAYFVKENLPAIQLLLDGLIPVDGKLKNISTEKTELLLEILEELSDEQVVLFCTYHYEVDQIKEVLEKANITYAMRTGKNNEDEKDKAIEDFTNNKVRILLGTTSANAEGLNLTNCAKMIYYSLNFDLLHYSQSLKRIHRIGQEEKVTYYYLISTDLDDDKYVGLDSFALKHLGIKETNSNELFENNS